MRASVKRFVLSPPARAPAVHPPLPLVPRAHWRAAGLSRDSTPDGFAPQARPDPPPRTPLRRRLVSILHHRRACAAGSSRSASRVESSAWAPALGSHCGLRGRLRHRRAARSEPIVHCRWCHAPRLSVLLARAASSGSRVPSARAAPLSASRPRPRRARLPTPAPRPRQIGSRGRRRGCSSARTSPPTGLEHGREQAQGPRSCTHGRGERPRTWPRDRVSVFCHVLSCLLNTCVHVCMFLS